MSEVVDVTFRAREQDIDYWEKILRGLEDGEAGALFQEKIARFGDAVDEYLEELIDEEEGYGPDAFNLSAWRRDGDLFTLEFDFPDIDFADDLRKLFSLCPVSELKVIADWE
ncbi:hypothetical protein Maes01_01498 [Microbulbifer aestuariivivens]|uniref:Uncharacterized protein n=1 Tax=Microbulbifer aestuariivivens TaxID=1908308 RepID=A0ABP9WP82_9GAMM